jgi:hypothetical protein
MRQIKDSQVRPGARVRSLPEHTKERCIPCANKCTTGSEVAASNQASNYASATVSYIIRAKFATAARKKHSSVKSES